MPVQERTSEVTMKGKPIALLGNLPKIGTPAPDCTLTANDLSEVSLSSFKGKKCLISVVPSLDTPVCDLQTKRFNQEAGRLGDSVALLTVSMDLPFAQKRWCGATSSSKVTTLSDYRYASFGEKFGVLIKGLRLLTRAIFILDEKGTVRYQQLVKEVTTEPNYDEALNTFKNL